MQWTLCIWLLLALGGSNLAQAQDQGVAAPPVSMPSWTVPVLRLVSATHVEPTTGVILSDSGLVLVPEDFAGMGDEIIVLDGGTDIIRNGRPARIEKIFTQEGLQVLSVEGLTRQGVTLAAGSLEEGSQVTLTAFPPAELITEGEPPLNIPASITLVGENGRPSISGEAQLPNVTGALVDSCGNLVGVSLADDVQSMETSPSTRYQWRETLLHVLREMQVAPREFDCSGSKQAGEEESPLPAEEPVVEETATVQAESQPDEEPVAEEQDSEQQADIQQDEQAPLETEILPPFEKDFAQKPQEDEESGRSGWMWLLAAIILIGLGFGLHRLRQDKNVDTGAEPESTGTDTEHDVDTLEEESSAPEPLLESLLLIRGELADGTAFEDSCAVSENAINVVIGRGETDLVIDSPAVSRQHAGLNGTARDLTVSDFGSSNGTSINGVPCLEGEIMFIEPGDTLVLGDARCSLEIKPRDSSGSGKE
jgi:hypothetical protein